MVSTADDHRQVIAQIVNELRHRQIAEIAVRLQFVRRHAQDRGMAGQIHRIGDDGGGGIGL